MQFLTSTILLVLAAATTITAHDDHKSAHGNMTYTTEIVTAYTTYCPDATQITYGTHTYTVSEATTLTISDCPCTVTIPVYTSIETSCSTCHSVSTASTPIYPTTIRSSSSSSSSRNSTAIAPSTIATTVSPYPSSTTTTTMTSTRPASISASYTSSRNGTSPPIATFTGAATRLNVLGTGLMGMGLFALVL